MFVHESRFSARSRPRRHRGSLTRTRENDPVDRIGIVDTMFARYDMGSEAAAELMDCPGFGTRFEIVHRTVPGFKDLGVACKKLIEEEGCRVVVALAMPGAAPIDKACAHEASQGVMLAQLLTNTHVLEVFVHEDESEDPDELAAVCRDRSRKHARNAYWLVYEPDQLARRAGQGIRQGFADAGPLLRSTG
jgi:riboflavin synthase